MMENEDQLRAISNGKFEELDEDESGAIDKDELRNALESLATELEINF